MFQAFHSKWYCKCYCQAKQIRQAEQQVMVGHLPMEILRMVHKLMVHEGLVEGVVQDSTIKRICIQQGVLEILINMRMRRWLNSEGCQFVFYYCYSYLFVIIHFTLSIRILSLILWCCNTMLLQICYRILPSTVWSVWMLIPLWGGGGGGGSDSTKKRVLCSWQWWRLKRFSEQPNTKWTSA